MNVRFARNNMGTSFFSIIIPALNEEKYLPILLTDLKNQTHEVFEVIVVDGQSEDKTVQKAEKFTRFFFSFKIIKSEKRNVSYQRNLGAKHAQGKWLLFMDADNRLPEYFLDGVKYRIAESKCDVFTTYNVPDTDNPADKLIAQSFNATIEVAHRLEMPAAYGAMIGISKEGFAKTGGFDTVHIPFEDKKFIRTAVKKNLDFQVFKDPKFVYSTRRYKTGGRLKMLQKYIKLNFKDEAKLRIDKEQDYPMGGHVFKSKRK